MTAWEFLLTIVIGFFCLVALVASMFGAGYLVRLVSDWLESWYSRRFLWPWRARAFWRLRSAGVSMDKAWSLTKRR
jgi:hypothetical protein